ncbi:hypothetical protein DR66_3779 [Delftia acidovorans]|nr:hypothetical protein DR66_3779 [Delftia acidovorans]
MHGLECAYQLGHGLLVLQLLKQQAVALILGLQAPPMTSAAPVAARCV